MKLFLERIRSVLGADAVLEGDADLLRYRTSTLGVVRRVPAAILPASVEHIVRLVQLAGEHRVPLYPVSTGRNWGYGSGSPIVDGCVVVNLSRMNRVVDFDARTGVVTLEPGVTQADLSAYLTRNRLPFLVPTTGAGPTCSIVGNALERGYGITPAADHFSAVTSIEAVLADGSTYRSPLAAMGAPACDRAFKWGFGPYVDGLFTQGAFGIVTRMSIALARRPEYIRAFFFGLRDDSLLEHAVEAVQSVLAALPGTVGGINLMDARRMLAMAAPYPADRVGPDGLIPDEVILRLARQYGVMPWNGFGTLYGTARVVSAAQKDIRQRLRRVASRLLFLSPERAVSLQRLGSRIPWVPHRLKRTLCVLRSSLELVAGTPNETALPLAYWKREGGAAGKSAPLDPDRDGCGLLWYSPLVEMKPDRVRRYVTMVPEVVRPFGLEPLITLTSLSERCFDSTVPLLFNPRSAQECESVIECHRMLLESGLRDGFVPYRGGVQSMAWFTERAPEFWDLIAVLKNAIDPAGLISPGRYARTPASR